MLFQRVKKSLLQRAWLFILMSALLALPAIPLHAQQTPQQTPTTGWPYSGIGYYQYLPPGYASNTDQYPLVVFLHGLGEKGNGTTELPRLLSNGIPRLINTGTNFPFICISPQLKSPMGDWYAFYIDEVVEYARKNLRIDATRIYVTGLSLGGGGAWGYSEVYPNKVAALAPICGHYNNPATACTAYSATNMPIWAFHGDADGTVPIGRTQVMINALNACAPAMVPKPIFTIYPGVGHNSWDRAYRTDHSLHDPNLYEWMLGQRNTSLILNAGNDISLNLPQNSTSITATASSTSGSITSYIWTKVSGPNATITNAANATVSLTDLVEGVYVFRITVANSLGESLTDDVKVSVIQSNPAPTANAGPDFAITLPTNSTNLIGSGSDDGSIASYAWTKQSGPTATLTGASAATLSLSNLIEGIYVFLLTVTDNKGATASDAVTVTVKAAAANQPPSVSAGPDFNVNLPTSTANITGTASDPDDAIASYLWEKVSGGAVTITNASSPTVSLTGLAAGIYTFRLTVADTKGVKVSDLVVVTVVAVNQNPIAYAGDDIVITLPTNSTNIIGASVDPEGGPNTYAWSQVTGPNTATLGNATTNTVSASNLIQGVYQFRVTVTDNKGATGSDVMNVTVNAAPVNNPPTANAGNDKSITLPLNTVTFNGSGTDNEGPIASYSWSLVTGPPATLVNQNTANLTANNLIAGIYSFRLTVTDNKGATGTDLVSLVVNPEAVNQAPVANAGNDASIVLPTNSLMLTGSGTDDVQVVSYAWTQVSGPAATLLGASTAVLSLSNLLEGVYTFRLTVTDNKGATGTDEVKLTVTSINTGPTASAGNDIILNLPANSATLMGSGQDNDGTISAYLWEQQTGPNTATLVNQNTSSVQISALVAGNYTFRLTVTDDDGAQGTDEVKVVVNAANLTPTANAGVDKSITLPTNSVNFTGFGSDPDPNGSIASFTWTKLSGPAATLTNANTATVTASALIPGNYTFRLTVTDNLGASNFDDVNLVVNPEVINLPPVANAGGNKIISLPQNSVNVTGQGSDPEGPVTFLWSKVSGPSVTLSNETTAVLSLENLLEGLYTLRLTVTDNKGLTAVDDVDVTVLPATVNKAPQAAAGPNVTLTLPLNSTTIFGSGSDDDGSVVSYAWTKVSGAAATLTNPGTATLSVSDLIAGVYTFRLLVTDNLGATDTDDVTVIVNPEATNQAPSANAGNDKFITLPTSILTLNGSGADPDGSIVKYTWVKLSGPSVTLGQLDLASLSMSDLVEGAYEFQLLVEDDKGLTGTDDVMVTVLPAAINQPPIADAGIDKAVFLPETSVILLGQGSDFEGALLTYAWAQIGGSSTIQLVNASTPTLTVNNLSEGVYLFRLTVTDDKGATAFDETFVTVYAPAVNQPPTVSAGSDISMKLPANNASITANYFDNDGTVDIIQWTKISGPNVTLAGTGTETIEMTDLEAGAYTFQVTVTDNEGATGIDQVEIVVLPASINLPPVVSAGADASIQLPKNSETLTGTASDDGQVQSLLWQKIAGGTVTLNGETTASLSLSGLLEGTYTFRLTATDDQGLTSFDDVSVKVEAEVKVVQPPTVSAGPDQKIQMPINAITITASAESPEGILTSYEWTQTDGSPVTIQNGSNVLELSNLIAGIYSFRVTVKDAVGQTASDDVTIQVLEEDPIVRVAELFSPDGRGEVSTETWSIENAFLLDDCEIIVYNRQGQKVYASKGYPTPWNGTFRGTPLPAGAYFYVFLCGGQKKQSGSVAIVRAK